MNRRTAGCIVLATLILVLLIAYFVAAFGSVRCYDIYDGSQVSGQACATSK